MFMQMLENYQETQLQNQEINRQTQENTKDLVNKVIEVMPKMGNTTNNNTNNTNNTLNFYLTNTCKEAESIHEFTERFVERIVDFFKDNYRKVAYNQINLPENVRDIFFKCLSENPQAKNFVQTTDVEKRNIIY